MRAVIQRVTESSVTVEDERIGEIGQGLLILLGVTESDSAADADYLVKKIAHLRIFEDDQAKMNRSLINIHGSALVVSQFTLYADTRKGRRPSFTAAAGPEKADDLYRYFVEQMKSLGVPVATGKFGAMMQVALVNDGPVTLILDSMLDPKKTARTVVHGKRAANEGS